MIVEVTRETGVYTVDFTPILTPGVKFAVLFDTIEDASVFISAMKKAYPNKCGGVWNPDRPLWDNSYDEYEGGMVYFPDVNNAEENGMQWCSANYASEYNYTIVSFSDLLMPDGPLDEGDQCISELFDLFQIQ